MINHLESRPPGNYALYLEERQQYDEEIKAQKVYCITICLVAGTRVISPQVPMISGRSSYHSRFFLTRDIISFSV